LSDGPSDSDDVRPDLAGDGRASAIGSTACGLSLPLTSTSIGEKDIHPQFPTVHPHNPSRPPSFIEAGNPDGADVSPRATFPLDSTSNRPSENCQSKCTSNHPFNPPSLGIHLTLIPQVVGGAKLPPYLQWITDMYARIPKGAATKKESKGFWAWYRNKYMHGEGGSKFMPVVHVYLLMFAFGYTYQVRLFLMHWGLT